MDTDLKRRWVRALRSGEYKQGSSALCRVVSHLDSDTGSTSMEWCCLGVLANLIDPRGWLGDSTEPGELSWHDNLITGYLYDVHATVPDGMELDAEMQQKLAQLNDDGLTFEHIANVIEVFVKAE